MRDLRRSTEKPGKHDEAIEGNHTSDRIRGVKRSREDNGEDNDGHYHRTYGYSSKRDHEDGRRRSPQARKRYSDVQRDLHDRYYRPSSERRLSTDSYKPGDSRRNSFQDSSTDQERLGNHRQDKRRRKSRHRLSAHDQERERRRSRSPVHHSHHSEKRIRIRTDERKYRFRLSRSPTSDVSDEENYRRRRSEKRHNSKHHEKGRDRDTTSSQRMPQQIREISPDSPIHLSEADSDPLEALIGPIPPPLSPSPPKIRVRGRGALAASSGIDDRFSHSYDPTTDVKPDDDDDEDWDQALEALKDRQRWKQQGAERLLAAGFTEDEVEKWQKGSEKAEDDLIWRKRGECREWDRGKVLDADGQVQYQPDWGRLKGT